MIFDSPLLDNAGKEIRKDFNCFELFEDEIDVLLCDGGIDSSEPKVEVYKVVYVGLHLAGFKYAGKRLLSWEVNPLVDLFLDACEQVQQSLVSLGRTHVCDHLMEIRIIFVMLIVMMMFMMVLMMMLMLVVMMLVLMSMMAVVLMTVTLSQDHQNSNNRHNYLRLHY